MALFTSNDLTASIPEAHVLLATDDTSAGVIDEAVVAVVEADASRWISGYLQLAGLTIPATIPDRLKHIAIKYAEYTLWRRRGGYDRAKQIYDEWIKPANDWLQKIADGEDHLTPSAAAGNAPLAITEDSKTYIESGSNWA